MPTLVVVGEFEFVPEHCFRSSQERARYLLASVFVGIEAPPLRRGIELVRWRVLALHPIFRGIRGISSATDDRCRRVRIRSGALFSR